MASFPPGSRLGRYEIKEQLGQGGMASVFKALDPSLNRDVAIKVLFPFYTNQPSFRERFSQEARTIARLRHPNILQIFDFGEEGGVTFIVSELVTGGSLEDARHGPMPVGEALRILRPLAEALDYAHSRGVVHRDIKPSNVLIDSNSRPILADFGLSRVMEQAHRLTSPYEALGTPDYMSPEQALGQNTDYRSDLYSLGILTYELILGRTPFHADTPTGTLMAHINQPLGFQEDGGPLVSPAVKAVLLKATAKAPAERFASAIGMVAALERAAGYGAEARVQASEPPSTLVLPGTSTDAAVPAEAYPGQARPESPARRRRLIATAGLALGLLAVVAVGVALFLRQADGGTGNSPPAPILSGPPAQPASPSPVAVVAPAPAPTPTPSVQTCDTGPLAERLACLEKLVAQIKSRVSDLRDISADQDIKLNLRTRDQLAGLADGLFKREYVRNQVFHAEELYKTLGLLRPQDDLERITRDILVQQVVALFDDENEAFYILSDAPSIGPIEEIGYASAHMAGLQQKRFDISGMRRNAREHGTFDQYRAVTAFIGGEVFQILQGYDNRFLSSEQSAELRKPVPGNLLTGAPRVVQKTILFPEKEGANFVAEVFSSARSWNAVNSVYDRPPTSTEQIIHPEKYVNEEGAAIPNLPYIEGALGRGWNPLSPNTMGELLLRTYLEEHLAADVASSAAAGWGGDRYALLIGPEAEQVLVLLVNWDTEADCAEFAGAFDEFMRAKTGGSVAPRREGGGQTWWAIAGQTVLLGKSDLSTLLVFANDEALVRRVLAAFPRE